MEASILQSVASGGSVAVLAVIIFIMYQRDKKELIDRMREERGEENARWKQQIDNYDKITKELVDCRSADASSRESLANNLGQLAESIRSCGLRDNHVDRE